MRKGSGWGTLAVMGSLAAVMMAGSMGCAGLSENRSVSAKRPLDEAIQAAVSELQIGKTTRAECEALFGKPSAKEEKNGPNGKSELAHYLKVGERWAKGYARSVALEFKEGILNGYIFGSSYEEDRTTFAVTNVAKIEWAASKKEDVERLLGKPHGRIRCPSEIWQTTRNCGGLNEEVWIFHNLDGVPLMDGKRMKPMFFGDRCEITFDKFDIVTDVTTANRAD